MSTPDVPPVNHELLTGAGAGAVDVAASPLVDDAARLHTAQRWAAAVLMVATVLLGGYLAVLVAFAWLVASAWDALTSRSVGALDLASLVVDVLPALLVGWCCGLAATTVIARGEALGARMAGVAAGGVGVLLGALVLRLTDLL